MVAVAAGGTDRPEEELEEAAGWVDTEDEDDAEEAVDGA